MSNYIKKMGRCILYVVLGLTISSCDKLLDKEPENMVSLEVLFSDLPGTKAALSGVYHNMFSSVYYGGARMLYPELVGGNVVNMTTNRTNYMDVYDFIADAESSSMNTIYAQLYTNLYNINNIILHTPQLTDAAVSEKNELLAQAYGLRALMHLDLVQLFAQPYNYSSDASHLGIVLSTSPIKVGDTNIRRSSVSEVYNQIESDLLQSQDLFAAGRSIFTGSAKLYINSSAIKALRSRVALHRGDYELAVQLTTELIDANYPLYTTDEYLSSWTSSAGKETIFEIGVPESFAGVSLGSYYSKNSSEFQFAPSNDLLEIYSASDIRKEGGTFKYSTYGSGATSVKVCRISEMYLIRAEASLHRSNLQQALNDLNLIRLRGNPAADRLTSMNAEQLGNEIFLERRRELALEGFLFFDIVRQKRNLRRTNCTGNFCNLDYPSQKFVLPIPFNSVLANANMVQNPSY